MDAAGPGAVVRFWATWHGPGGGEFTNGTLRVYLGRQERSRSSKPPSPRSSTAGWLAGPAAVRGRFPRNRLPAPRPQPLPAHSLCQALQDHVFHRRLLIDRGAKRVKPCTTRSIIARTTAGTEVESFSMQQLRQLAAGSEADRRSDCSARAETARLIGQSDRGNSRCLLDAGQSRSLEMSGSRRGPATRHPLRRPMTCRRHCVPRSCDWSLMANQTGWCPVGDFFGIGYQVQPYRSWYTAGRGRRPDDLLLGHAVSENPLA